MFEKCEPSACNLVPPSARITPITFEKMIVVHYVPTNVLVCNEKW